MEKGHHGAGVKCLGEVYCHFCTGSTSNAIIITFSFLFAGEKKDWFMKANHLM